MNDPDAIRMDRIYRFQRHVYDVTRPLFLAGRDRLLAGIDVPPAGAVLEVGCGTGRNLRLLAEWLPEVRLYGLDVSAAMLRTAADRLPASLRERATFVQAAAGSGDPRAAFGRGEPFDAIVFSYSLSMMPGREAVLRAARGALAPGGVIHIVDFGEFGGWLPPARTMALAWLRAWSVRPGPTGAEILRGLGMNVDEERLLRGYAFVARGR